MYGEGHACSLVGDRSSGLHRVVDDRRRERRMEVKGDARELDGVRHGYAQGSGQNNRDELCLTCQYMLQDQPQCTRLTKLYMSERPTVRVSGLSNVCEYIQSRNSRSLVLINNIMRCLSVGRRST